MSTLTADLDLKRYGRLLAKAGPTVIRSEEENDRMLCSVESLMAKGEDNHDFESKAYPIPKSAPHEALEFLLEQRDLKPTDLWPVIGSKSRVSEILAGKYSISKEHAKKPIGRQFYPSDSALKLTGCQGTPPRHLP